jgi:hypothetical protein
MGYSTYFLTIMMTTSSFVASEVLVDTGFDSVKINKKNKKGWSITDSYQGGSKEIYGKVKAGVIEILDQKKNSGDMVNLRQSFSKLDAGTLKFDFTFHDKKGGFACTVFNAMDVRKSKAFPFDLKINGRNIALNQGGRSKNDLEIAPFKPELNVWYRAIFKFNTVSNNVSAEIKNGNKVLARCSTKTRTDKKVPLDSLRVRTSGHGTAHFSIKNISLEK